MDRIFAEQVRRNEAARYGWDLYQRHRERVTQLLVGSATSASATLCILGAGNCNDLDLQCLRKRFAAIYLVDLDPEALAAGCEIQGVAADPAIHCVGGIDVTGVAARLQSWSPQQPVDPQDLETVLHEARTHQIPGLPPEPFDVVASVGLLSQLIEMVLSSRDVQQPEFLAVMTAIRLRHLRMLLELTRPGGKAWLFFEVVASTTLPELLQTPEAMLLPLLQRAVAQQNFFTGLHPGIINRLFQEDPELSASISSLDTQAPWLWTFFARTYAVCAIGATKAPSSAKPETSRDPEIRDH